MNPRLYFDEKTLKKLGDVFVVNTYFPIKTVPDSADYFLLVYIAHSNAIHNIDNTSRKLERRRCRANIAECSQFIHLYP